MARQFSGERLRAACARGELTAQELARLTGCSVSAVYKWRTGLNCPGANELAAVADALGIPLEELYTPVPPPDPEEPARSATGEVA